MIRIIFRSNRSVRLSNLYGFAGYDNSLPSMQSFLLIRGPGVVQPVLTPEKIAQVDAVDVFPLIAHLLGNKYMLYSNINKVLKCKFK